MSLARYRMVSGYALRQPLRSLLQDLSYNSLNTRDFSSRKAYSTLKTFVEILEPISKPFIKWVGAYAAAISMNKLRVRREMRVHTSVPLMR